MKNNHNGIRKKHTINSPSTEQTVHQMIFYLADYIVFVDYMVVEMFNVFKLMQENISSPNKVYRK